MDEQRKSFGTSIFCAAQRSASILFAIFLLKFSSATFSQFFDCKNASKRNGAMPIAKC